MRIKYTIFLTFAFLLLTLGTAHAVNFTATGNPDDTLAGTLISAEAANETLNYTDINDNPKPEVNPVGDITITVLPVYGFSVGYYRAVDVVGRNSNFGYINQTRYMYVGITNEGNVSDTYTVTAEFSSSPLKGAGTWVVEYWRDNAPYGTAEGSDVLIATLTEGTTTSEIVSVAEDAAYYCYLKVVYPDNTANPDDRINTGCSIKTSSTPVGQYTGANGLTYAGTSEFGAGVPAAWRVCKPLLTINSRTVTVDAPLTPYGGNATDAVPGSIISYKTEYSVATGSQYCTAESVIFIDKIPSNTHLAHINKGTLGGSSTDHVKLTNDNTKASGSWTIWYTTADPPTTTNYGEYTNWTMVGTLPADAKAYFPASSATYRLTPSPDAQAGAKWIKWERDKIDPYNEQLRTLNWGVTIR